MAGAMRADGRTGSLKERASGSEVEVRSVPSFSRRDLRYTRVEIVESTEA